MLWIFFIVQAFGATCDILCVKDCEKNPFQNGIERCCPGLNLYEKNYCSIVCEESEGEYDCKSFCVKENDKNCFDNCQNFCDERSNDCAETCFHEFCENNHKSVNYWYAIGIFLLFMCFSIGLYLRISEINRKILQGQFSNIRH